MRKLDGGDADVENVPSKRRVYISFQRRIDQLEEFKRIHGHVNVQSTSDEYDANIYRPLYKWLDLQRVKKRKGNLSDDQVRRLNEMGVVWDPLDASWRSCYKELKTFAKRNGHCIVPVTEGRLGPWVAAQRSMYKKLNNQTDGTATPSSITLTTERIRLLNSIGFVWDTHQHRFDSKLDQLRQYKQEHGHINIGMGDGPLGQWVVNRKADYARHLRGERSFLTSERILALEELGFNSSMALGLSSSTLPIAATTEKTWDESYEDLLAFREEHGHCIVRESHGELGWWVKTQRQWKRNLTAALKKKLLKQNAKKSKMLGTSVLESFSGDATQQDAIKSIFSFDATTEQRLDKLNSIGFVWDVAEYRWDVQYQRLKKYREVHGHVDVPFGYSDGPLSRWVIRQRHLWRDGKLSNNRIVLLDDLGFCWNRASVRRQRHDIVWEENFQRLCNFGNKHGHYHVSLSPDARFYDWVRGQRYLCHGYDRGIANSMTSDRREKLRSIEFIPNKDEEKEKGETEESNSKGTTVCT